VQEVVDATWTAVGALYRMGREARRTLRSHIESDSRIDSPVPPQKRSNLRVFAVLLVGAGAIAGAIAFGVSAGYVTWPSGSADSAQTSPDPSSQDARATTSAAAADSDEANADVDTDSFSGRAEDAATLEPTPTTASAAAGAEQPEPAVQHHVPDEAAAVEEPVDPCTAWRTGQAGKDEEPQLEGAVMAYCDAIDAFNDMEGGVYLATFSAPLLWYSTPDPLTRADLRNARGARFREDRAFSRYLIDELRIVSALSDADTVVFFEEGRLLHHRGGCRTHNKAIRMRRSSNAPFEWAVDAEVSAFSHQAWPDAYDATSRFLTTHTGTIADTCSGLEWWTGPLESMPPESTCGGVEAWHVESRVGDDPLLPRLTEWRAPTVVELGTLRDSECARRGGSPPDVDAVVVRDGTVRRIVSPGAPGSIRATHALLVRRAAHENPRVDIDLPTQPTVFQARPTLDVSVRRPVLAGDVAPTRSSDDDAPDREPGALQRAPLDGARPGTPSIRPIRPTATPNLRRPGTSDDR